MSPPGRDRPGAAATVAVLDKRGRFLVAEPFFTPGPRMVVDRDTRAKVGDLVLVRGARPGGPARGGGGGGGRGGAHAKLVRRLGRPDVAADVLEALMLDRGLQRRFDPAVEHEAKAARDRGPRDADGGARRDLTALATFTIDPATARDFDDAISAEALDGGGTRVWVHIADVSAYVAPGSLVDREAARRGTSVYVPGRVEPMLPEALSNDACSLVPGAPRAAVTVQMDFAADATVARASFHRSTIRSDERLDYDRVDAIFAGDEQARAPWAAPLAAARAVAATLAQRRARTDALEIDTAEPEFRFDRAGHVHAAPASEHTESHRLIEHLMIAANEQVATLLETQRVPALFRVHERPDPEKVARLVGQLASLDVATPPVPEHPSPSQAAEIVGECSRAVAAHARRRDGRGRTALTFLVLRSLQQAVYAPRNQGHAGLGLTRYCHFTSPIRRYPDVVCHRALLSAVGGGEQAPRAGDMEEAGTWASARERDALQIERVADRVATCFVLERELFETGFDREFDGEVTGVIGAGAFVTFGSGYEGLLAVRRLRGEWWELNEEQTILHGTRSGATIRLGDAVRVRVDRVETARGRVDLLPVELGSGAAD